MKCCNLKTLSYISAYFQLFIIILFAILITVMNFLITHDSLLELFNLVLFMACIVAIPLLVIALIGINENRKELIGFFMHGMHILLAIVVASLIYHLVMEYKQHGDLSYIFKEVLNESLGIPLEVLLIAPIHILHKRMPASTHLPCEQQETNAMELNSLTPKQ